MYGPVVQSALDLDYPPGKLTVWVLDDGREESVQEHVKVRQACESLLATCLQLLLCSCLCGGIGCLH